MHIFYRYIKFFLKMFSIRHIYDFTFMIYKLFNNYVTINVNNAIFQINMYVYVCEIYYSTSERDFKYFINPLINSPLLILFNLMQRKNA